MLAKPLLFLSAYAPLFALLAVRFEPKPLMYTCIGLAAGGVVALILLLLVDARSTRGTYQLTKVRDAGAEVGAYLGAYLLPFVTVSTPSVRDQVSYALFILVAAAIYLRSSVVQINPLLYVIGYQVLAVHDSNGLRAYLVTRKKRNAGEVVLATRFRGDVLIERRQ